MKNYDIAAQFGLSLEKYTLSLTHNTQATLPTGIVSLKRPIFVAIVSASMPSTSGFEDYVIGSSWDLSSDLAPRITPQFSNNVSAMCEVIVAYKA